ncbi:YkgJ family cysteine cluster protein [Novipirellula artificiosorum]|uniref:Flagellin N-methylase n=1 Tax=Novipirellula artificiosorum TaxID=2528016 RepID=A0A5C6DA49_9BACT|nr:YkgJ family cysteine cluster protein [Novipirellula artificiosorum]TWU33005.1 Flagellin N-methylase [Novipirellula artificiosorum]
MAKKDKAKKKSENKKPWYSDGLRFECTQCGDCCSGAPGFVWVSETEIQAMATKMDMDVDDFEHQFVRIVGREKSLKEYPDGDCILLDPESRGCGVYEARPIQCRTWPFWDSTLKKRSDWKDTCKVCPGSGSGRLYTFEEIETQRKQKEV